MSTGRYTDQEVAVSGSSAQFFENNYQELDDLPRNVSFTAPDDSGIDSDLLRAANRRGLVKQVGVVDVTDRCGHKRTVWRLSDDLCTMLEAYDRADGRKMPCGHTGFINDRDTEFLSCKTCGGRFTTAEVKAGLRDE